MGKTQSSPSKVKITKFSLDSLTAQGQQVSGGGDFDQTGTGFSCSSPTCAVPEDDCHKILPISSTDLGAPQNLGCFYQ